MQWPVKEADGRDEKEIKQTTKPCVRRSHRFRQRVRPLSAFRPDYSPWSPRMSANLQEEGAATRKTPEESNILRRPRRTNTVCNARNSVSLETLYFASTSLRAFTKI